MLSQSAITRNLLRLVRNIRAGTLPLDGDIPNLAQDWYDLLPDIGDADLDEAVTRWLRGDCPFWPMPGQLLALTATGRARAHIGSRPDAEAAFEHFRERMRLVCGANASGPSRDVPRWHLDQGDGYRNDAMFAALAKIGGAAKWGSLDLSHPAAVHSVREAWIGAYVDARGRQRDDVAAVAAVRQIGTQRAIAMGGK